jgi:hypothetical protein
MTVFLHKKFHLRGEALVAVIAMMLMKLLEALFNAREKGGYL